MTCTASCIAPASHLHRMAFCLHRMGVCPVPLYPRHAVHRIAHAVRRRCTAFRGALSFGEEEHHSAPDAPLRRGLLNDRALDPAIRSQARILLHEQSTNTQNDNKFRLNIGDNRKCHLNEGGLETLPAVRSARVTASN